MVQLPLAMPVIVEPLTLQTAGVVVLKVTSLPDAPPVALALVVPLTVMVESTNWIAPPTMVWVPLETVMACVTRGASL